MNRIGVDIGGTKIACAVFGPDGTILHEARMASLPELVEELPEKVARYSFSGAAKARIARAAFGDASGVRGAALLWPA